MAAVMQSYGPHPDQALEVWRGRADRPLVVVLHGGFWRPRWDRAHAVPQARALAATGCTVALPEYRRVPGDPDATCADVRAALGAAVAAVPHRGVVLVGHSAGGHLALWAATVCPPAALIRTVGLAPVADLALAERLDLGSGAVRAFLGVDASARPDLDPARLPPPACRTVVVTAGRDEDVPASVPRSYALHHPAAVVLDLPTAGHLDLVDPGHQDWAAVLAAVLGAAGAPGEAEGTGHGGGAGRRGADG